MCTVSKCPYNLLGEELVYNIPYLVPHRDTFRITNRIRSCIVTQQAYENRYKYNYGAPENERVIIYYNHYVRVKDKENLYDPRLYKDEIVNIEYGRISSHEKIFIPQTIVPIGIVMKDKIRQDSNEIISFSKKTKDILKAEGVRTKRGMENKTRK